RWEPTAGCCIGPILRRNSAPALPAGTRGRMRQLPEFPEKPHSMILVLEPNTNPQSPEYKVLVGHLERLPGIHFRVHREVGSEVTLTEIYLIGNTGALTVDQMQVLPSVAKVVRVSEAYRVLGRHKQGD